MFYFVVGDDRQRLDVPAVFFRGRDRRRQMLARLVRGGRSWNAGDGLGAR